MNNWPEKLGYCLIFLLLSIFPTYWNLVYGFGHDQIYHHFVFLKKESYYFNPWQYRVLAPFIVEGFHQVLTALIYKGTKFHDAYTFTFKIFRTIQHIVIFVSLWHFYKHFIASKTLKLLILAVVSGAFAFGAHESDFSFNTYFDILFYVWAAWLIFCRKDLIWLLPIVFLAALNRETCLFIPFLPFIDYKHYFSATAWKKNTILVLAALFIYAAVFVSIRWYYGYVPQSPVGMETGWPIFRYNLTDLRTILQLFATLSVIPLIALFNLRKVDYRLQLLFCLVVPVWFFIHFWLVWAKETRIFLVPFTIVFLPVILNLIQKEFEPKPTISSE